MKLLQPYEPTYIPQKADALQDYIFSLEPKVSALLTVRVLGSAVVSTTAAALEYD